MIFSRSRGSAGRRGSGGQARRGRGGNSEPRIVDDLDAEPEDETPAGPDFGPYDVAEAPDDGRERLDLGALRIPAIAGVEIQMQAAPDGEIQQVLLVNNDSKLQLGVFAAPRTEGIWDEVRGTLRTSMAQAGARQEDTVGDYGPELKARLRDGSSTVDVRHVGVDGPRWFVHAVYIGAAAADPTKAGLLRDVLRGLVVDRGTDARPVSEPLPLRLPPQAAAQLAAAQAAQPPSAPADEAAAHSSVADRAEASRRREADGARNSARRTAAGRATGRRP